MSFPNEQEQEKIVLNEFRSQVEGFLSDKLLEDDTFLMRWLIAREFNVEKAVIMLKRYIEWRRENDIDHILEWEPAEDLKNACPYEISFYDREGRPVLVFPWAIWTPWDFTDNGRRDEYLKYVSQMLEKVISAIKPPATQFVLLADSEGFSFRHMAKVKAIEANLEVLKGFESRYPELMSRAFAVNSPKIFSVLFALLKPLMSTHTQEKLHIYDSNYEKWQKRLLHFISPDQLPPKYGGGEGEYHQIIKKEVERESLEPIALEVLR